MDLGFVQGVFDLVGENTCGKTGYNFCYFFLVRNMQDVVVYQNVIAKESQLEFDVNSRMIFFFARLAYFVFHVLEQPPHCTWKTVRQTDFEAEQIMMEYRALQDE